jgi:Fe-S cluster assembly iron-binding protein IscA
MIEISDIACHEINKVLIMEQHKGKSLFVNFMGFGCSGPVLGLALDEPDNNYSVFKSNGIDVYIHPDLAGQLKPFGGVTIDFVDNGPDQRGFVVDTKVKPQGLDCSQGCGESGCPEKSDTDKD